MSPTPLSLLCALLLTLPLAIVFTINTDTVTTTTTTIPPPSATLHYKNPISRPPRKIITQSPKPINPTPSTSPPPLTEEIDGGDDDDDDSSLFHLASRVNPNPLPAGAPKKLAFMFLTTGPLPLAPLWEVYFNRTKRKNQYNIYIHTDPKHDVVFQGVFTNRTIPSKPTRRHSPSLAAAHRRLLARALLDDPLNYMFALVSPSCIPLHSFDFTYKTLVYSKKSFIEILENEATAWGRWAARGETAMLPEVEFRNFRIGSQFSVLTRHHAMLVVSDTRLWSKFKLPCLQENINNNRCFPEENYFPTLLSMVARKGCVPATLTYVDWKGQTDGHPHSFRGLEVNPELIRTLRRRRPRYGHEEINGSDASVTRRDDPYLFARKFGSDTVGALLDIADDVILRG